MSGKLPGTWKEVDEDYIPYLKEKKNSSEKGKDEVYSIRIGFMMCAVFCGFGVWFILEEMKGKEGYIKILAFFVLVALFYGIFMSAKISHEIGRIKND